MCATPVRRAGWGRGAPPRDPEGIQVNLSLGQLRWPKFLKGWGEPPSPTTRKPPPIMPDETLGVRGGRLGRTNVRPARPDQRLIHRTGAAGPAKPPEEGA